MYNMNEHLFYGDWKITMEDYRKEKGGGKIIKLADFVEYQQGSGEKIQDDAYDDQVQQLKQFNR